MRTGEISRPVPIFPGKVRTHKQAWHLTARTDKLGQDWRRVEIDPKWMRVCVRIRTGFAPAADRVVVPRFDLL